MARAICALEQDVAVAGERSAPTREIPAAQFLKVGVREMGGLPSAVLRDDFIAGAVLAANKRIAPFRAPIGSFGEAEFDAAPVIWIAQADDSRHSARFRLRGGVECGFVCLVHDCLLVF